MKELEEKLVGTLRQQGSRPLTLVELARLAGLGGRDRKRLAEVLGGLVASGRVVENRQGRYGLTEKLDLVAGQLEVNERGFGFVIPDQVGAPDVYVSKEDMGSAMHRDRVVVRVERRRGERVGGRVVRVLERFHRSILGVYHPGDRSYGFVVPMDARFPHDCFVPAGQELDAKRGQVVEVELLEYPTETKGPVGRITKVLGRPGEPGIEAEIVIREYNLRDAFPREVEGELAKLPDDVRPEETRRRQDLRELFTFTIDPETARDYDDAISVEEEGDDVWLSVHIADVGAYVRPGTAIDTEAEARGTSVYFPDRVLPMLPEKLSNGLCSLKAGVDRLTLTCRMRYDRKGAKLAAELYPSVIRSDHRLTYEQVGEMLADGAAGPAGDGRLLPALRTFAALAQAIRRQRERRGSLLFTLPDTRIVYDDEGRIVDIRKEVSDLSHQIIEEAMIAANESVSELAGRRSLPFIYRIHETPDPDAVETLQVLARAFDIPWKKASKPTPGLYQKISRHLAGRPEESVVTMLLLRTLKQARYHFENAGHFGLASTAYTHFTSPIRRFPDLIVHRLLKHTIGFERMSKKAFEALTTRLEEISQATSRQERTAEAAERDLVAWKKVLFMAGRVGEEFDGFIIGVAAFGLFVEIDPLFVEGLIHISSLGDEYFRHDAEGFKLVGAESGRTFRIGDRLRVRVSRVDEERRKIDFEPVGHVRSGRTAAGTAAPGRRPGVAQAAKGTGARPGRPSREPAPRPAQGSRGRRPGPSEPRSRRRRKSS